MIMWNPSLSPFLKILPTSSPSFISVLLTPPGVLPSVHTAVYLPTAGKDGEWLTTLIDLEQHVILNAEKYGNPATFLRGDFNASSKNKTRNATLSAVISRLKLAKVQLNQHITTLPETVKVTQTLIYYYSVTVGRVMADQLMGHQVEQMMLGHMIVEQMILEQMVVEQMIVELMIVEQTIVYLVVFLKHYQKYIASSNIP